MLRNRNTRQSTGQKKMQPGSGLKLCIGASEILYPDVTIVGTAISFFNVSVRHRLTSQKFGAELFMRNGGSQSLRLKLSWSAKPKRNVPRVEPLVKRTGYKHSLPHPPPSSIGKHLQPHVSNHPECLIRGRCYQNVAKATFITFAVPNLREEDS